MRHITRVYNTRYKQQFHMCHTSLNSNNAAPGRGIYHQGILAYVCSRFLGVCEIAGSHEAR